MAVVTVAGSGTVNLLPHFAADGSVDRGWPRPRWRSDPVPVVPRIRCHFDVVRRGERSHPHCAAGDHDRYRRFRAHLLRTVVRIAAGVSFRPPLADVDSGALDVMAAAGGQFLSTFFTAIYVTAAVGCALTSQASVARVLYAMGRDGVLSRRILGHCSARFGTPTFAILAVSVVSLVAIWIDLATLASIISFGALAAFSAVNLSVFKHYYIDGHQRSGSGVVNNVVLPLIGFALTVWLWTNLSKLTLVVGLIWFAVGFVWLCIVTRGFHRPTPVLELQE